jgi:hypothetical protein
MSAVIIRIVEILRRLGIDEPDIEGYMEEGKLLLLLLVKARRFKVEQTCKPVHAQKSIQTRENRPIVS